MTGVYLSKDASDPSKCPWCRFAGRCPGVSSIREMRPSIGLLAGIFVEPYCIGAVTVWLI